MTVLNFLILNYCMGGQLGCLNTIFRALWVNDRPEEELVETHHYVLDLRNMIESTCKIARGHLINFQDRYKTHFDRKAKVGSLEIGEKGYHCTSHGLKLIANAVYGSL